MTNVATINSLIKTTIQAVFDAAPEPFFGFHNAEYLMDRRTTGFTVPKDLVDYTLFKEELVDPNTKAIVVVPNLDDWATIRDTFTHGLGPESKFRVYDTDGQVIDAYNFGSKSHLKLAKLLKIDPELKEIVKTSHITFVANGVDREVPRGFVFEYHAERNGFIIKQVLARYLGQVRMVNEIISNINTDTPALATLKKDDPREPLDLVVVYNSRKFFDKVRINKFYTWLSTQAHGKTKVVLIN